MENALFEYSGGWDQLGDFAVVFYGCELKVPIGPYNIGETISSICVDFEGGTLETYDADARQPTSTHKVRMVLDN